MQQEDGGPSRDRAGARTGSGLQTNVAAALSYVLGLVTGVLFLALERDRFVRFHAMQSIFLTVAWVVFWVAFNVAIGILSLAPALGFLVALVGVLVGLVLGLGGVALWVLLIVRAYQGARWKLPFIGDFAERYADQ